MQLKLSKPICFFDLETTGVNVASDRIVEISVLKVYPNGNKESHTWRVNPTVPIPRGASDIHGITDDMVADEPTFKELAPKVHALMKESDLAGYNSNRFDIPLLAEELLRADVDFDLKKALAVDVQTIFHKKEKRTLEAAYKFYCDKTLENAHSAEADTIATYEVLLAQLDKYEDLQKDVPWLSQFSAHKNFADFAGFIGFTKEKKEIFMFGKHKGQLVEDVLEKEPGYFGWLLNADFPLYTKKILTRVKLRKLNNKF
ncbi:3'-5' exonuclease [Aureisphaera galaxeae]|uniref:3'-5' exonuclease n=1 Tax=Aureisphaera galaxeae TaxID=1538023 RepID=UPI002350F64D|nr:3'-5' exonuclease [Aureisphaera galaxeae]MDC8005452.1 3'-5' exonuclease [Aureisphaera galaxeae]